MFSTIYSGYDTYQTYRSDKCSKKVKKLVQEMEQRKDQLPSSPERKALEQKINVLKTNGKAKHVQIGILRTGVHFVKALASNLAGPIGTGIATYATHETEERIQIEKNCVITKAEFKGGSRKFAVKSKQKTKTNSAAKEAAKATFCGMIGKVAMGSCIVAWGISYGNSLIYGET